MIFFFYDFLIILASFISYSKVESLVFKGSKRSNYFGVIE